MVSLQDLLKYKHEVQIHHPDDKEKILATVWIRTIGDNDLKESFRLARIASTEKRAKLRDANTEEYRDELLPLTDLSREEKESIIVESNRTRFVNESVVKVNREELIKIEEVAQEPDAPTLAEQETFDALIIKQESDYRKRLDDFVTNRTDEVRNRLKLATDDEVTKEAQQEVANVLPLQTFFAELSAQKVFRGTYKDKDCKIRAYTTIDEFYATHDSIKEQLIQAYDKLEINPDDIKNS